MAGTVLNEFEKYKLVNFEGIFNSKSYLLTDPDANSILIDAGVEDPNQLFLVLKYSGLLLKAIILTHEHFDHVVSLREIHLATGAKICCSPICAENLNISRENLSIYSMDKPLIVGDLKFHYLSDLECLKIGQFFILPLFTPGHSPGSVCVRIDDIIFTGDTVLNGTKTPLTFPHSDRNTYKESIEKLLFHLKPGMMIYPGHGEPFTFNSIEDLRI